MGQVLVLELMPPAVWIVHIKYTEYGQEWVQWPVYGYKVWIEIVFEYTIKHTIQSLS